MAVNPQAFVDEQLKELIGKEIKSDYDLEGRVEAASIDVPIGARAYLVDNDFLPFKHRVKDLVEEHAIKSYDLTKKTELHKGHTYLVELLDLDLAPHQSARFSPKSSIGRVDLMVKSVIDGVGRNDYIPAGSKGSVWAKIKPQSFNVLLQEGMPLNQLRVFDETKESYCEIDPNEVLPGTYNPSSNLTTPPNKLSLSIGVPEGLVGYKAKHTNRFLDLTQIGVHEANDFFEEVHANNGVLQLEKDAFYILATRENISIPARYSVEMEAINPEHGELRVHYAGFFDPGFGLPNPASGVLEVRAQENMPVFHGQPICDLKFHKNSQEPTELYGSGSSNYQGQKGPRLAKYIKPSKKQ